MCWEVYEMPEVQLTKTPNDDITPSYALVTLWESEITAYGLYPGINEARSRRKWVEKVQRQYATDWTGRTCLMQSADAAFHRHWFALHSLSRTSNETQPFKKNNNRDVFLAARILIKCTLGRMSKAKAIEML